MVEIMLPLLSGMLTLGLIIGNQRISVGFAVALGYALGMGILGQLMLLIGWHEFPLNKDTTCLALFIYTSIISFLLLFRLYYVPHKSIDFSKNQEGLWSWKHKLFFAVMLAYVLYQIGFIFWNAFFIPINQADAFSLWAYKTKIFFYEHSLKSAPYLWPNAYPLQVPLDMAWVAFNIGRWHEGWLQTTVALNCLAFIIIVYNCMKFWADRLTALLTVSLIVSSLFFVLHATIVYCDFTIMFYTMSCLLLMSFGIDRRSSSFIILAGLMSAFATSVKLEGVGNWVLELIILCRFIFTKEFFNFRFVSKSLAGFVLPFFIVELNFLLYKAHYRIAELLNSEHHFIHFSKESLKWTFDMIMALLDNFFFSENWNVLWPILIVLMLANWKTKKSFAINFFSVSLGVFLVYYFMVRTLVFIPNSPIMDTLSRLLLHFFPLCPVLIGLLIYHSLTNRRIQGASRPLELL